MILQDELAAVCNQVLWATDDGSSGFAGNVVDLMRQWRASGAPAPDLVHVIGPIPMMSAAAGLTREWGVRTFASLNPIMVDGTGMCGGCRVTVGGKPASLASKDLSSMRIKSIFKNYFGAIKLIRSRKTRPFVIINAKTVELRRRYLIDNFARGFSSQNRQRRVR